MKSLLIFKHKKGYNIGNDSLALLILTTLVFLIILLEQTGEFNFSYWTTILSILWCISFITYLISRLFLRELEFGNYEGKLILKPESIVVNKEEYKIDEIKSIEINAFDIKDHFQSSLLEFQRKLSNGLDNSITLNLKEGKNIKTYFLQTKSNKIQLFKNELINYYKLGKISWLHLIDILEITDYDKIQEFKKEIN